MNYESGDAAIDVAVRCPLGLVPLTLLGALLLLGVDRVVVPQLVLPPGSRNRRGDPGINFDALEVGDEAEQVQ